MADESQVFGSCCRKCVEALVGRLDEKFPLPGPKDGDAVTTEEALRPFNEREFLIFQIRCFIGSVADEMFGQKGSPETPEKLSDERLRFISDSRVTGSEASHGESVTMATELIDARLKIDRLSRAILAHKRHQKFPHSQEDKDLWLSIVD